MFRFLISILLLASLAACTITQTVEPASIGQDAKLCISENPAVRDGFLFEIQAILDTKRINYHLVKEVQATNACEWLLTYTANWRWDLALYMSYANIKVYHNGQLDGEAVYDSTGGGGNLGKFIDAETKIKELLDQLFDVESTFQGY